MYSALLHNVIFPLSLRLTRSRCYDVYQDMLKLERQHCDDIAALQLERARNLLEHAYNNVPFYREAMDKQGFAPAALTSIEQLAALPELSKAKIQRNFPDRITAQNLASDDWKYVSTRGTSDRLITIQDFGKRDNVRATELRAAHLSGDYRVGKVWAEIPPDVCSIVCGDEGEPDESVFGYAWEILKQRQFRQDRSISNLRGLIERRWLYRRHVYPPFGTAGTNLDEEKLSSYVAWIRADRPFLLKALPTYLYKIAQYVKQQQMEPLPVDCVKPMGATVSPVMRQKISAAFSGEYREDYGSSEFGNIACDCEVGDGLHVFSDSYVVEVVDDNGPLAPGQVGRLLITDLSNYAQPMIRYQIGDLGSISLEPCGCGRTSPRLTVKGRVEDALKTADNNYFTSDDAMDYFYAIDGVDQFQLVERQPKQLELVVVPELNETLDLSQLESGLLERLGAGYSVTSTQASTIAPESSGKFRFVKRLRQSR